MPSGRAIRAPVRVGLHTNAFWNALNRLHLQESTTFALLSFAVRNGLSIHVQVSRLLPPVSAFMMQNSCCCSNCCIEVWCGLVQFP